MSESAFKHRGLTVDHTPGSTLAAGDVVSIASRILGAPASAIEAGSPGTLQVEGVHAFTKDTSTAFAQGEVFWWDTSARKAVRLPNANTRFAGVAWKAALSADGFVWGKLLGDISPVEYMVIGFADLAAGADLTAVRLPGHPAGGKLVCNDVHFRGASVGVDDSNTSVFLLTDTDGNTIVTKTYNTGTQPPHGQESLGVPSDTHGVLAARESPRLSVTNTGTADLPQFDLILGYLPNR